MQVPDLITALRGTLGKLEVALDAISESLVWTEPEGYVQWCNSSLARLLGRSRVSALGMNLIELLPLEQNGSVLTTQEHPVSRTLSGETADLGIYGFRLQDQRYLEISGTLISAGQEKGNAIFVIRDITERYHADEKLNESRRELREYVDHMSTMSAKVALDGTLIFVNKMAEQASGLSRPELMKTNFLEGPWWTFDPEVQARVRSAFQRAVGGETIIYDEKLFVFGKTITIKFSLVPVYDIQGRVGYIIAEGTDITAQKQAEEALRLANKELESFSHSVSHDLRAPLRAIDGFSKELIQNLGHQLEGQNQEDLKRICSATARMEQLIDALLSLSRVARQEIRHEDVSLSALAETIISDLKNSQPERKVEFIIAPHLAVQGDPRLLRVALENLLGNAWKFTEKCDLPKIEFGATEEGGKQVFFVRDNGVGFDMTYANKLFGAFQRLHGGDEYPGTGIGLSTVQRIIHRHGGTIWADAKLQRGATFYFSLP